MAEPNALLEKDSDSCDWQVRRRLQHDNVIGLLDYVNEQSKVALLVNWSKSWSLPWLSTNLSQEPGERIACASNIAPLAPGNPPGNPTFPREHELTACICVPKLKVNVHDKIREKISKKKPKIWRFGRYAVCFQLYQTQTLLPIKCICFVYCIWYCV